MRLGTRPRGADIDERDPSEAALLHQVGRHHPDLEVDQRNDVPEVVAELREIRPDAAAVGADDLGLVTDRSDRPGHAGEGGEDERRLLDVDELGHGNAMTPLARAARWRCRRILHVIKANRSYRSSGYPSSAA